MFRVLRLTLVVLIAVAAAAASACSDDNPTTPTTPTAPTAVTETFSETVNVNGARTHTFTVNQTGLVSATLTAVAPDSASTLGLSIGTWSTTTNQCQIIIAKDEAVQGNTVVGNATAGQFCARVYDVGRLSASADYTITVVHF